MLALVLWPRGRWLVLAVSIPLALLAAGRAGPRRAQGGRRPRRPSAPSTSRCWPSSTGSPAGEPPFRIQIPPTKNRWEAAYVAREHPIARGWLRQLESDDFDLFTDGSLTAEAYREWLDDHAVGYVAVADAAA